MADAPTNDAPEAGSEPQVTFKVKTSGDKNHTITMSESAKVIDLKTKLAGQAFENIEVNRQRLIYSGRVMKNDDALSVYKIKPGNTVHMVKSAASNPPPAPAASSSTPVAPAVPQNMAAGTSANNLLAGLTGARFAGHANLPNADMFGADGGMGAPPSEDQMADMLSNPAVASTMNEALNNPAFIDMIIQSNPMLANMPNAREMLQSPYFRQMITNPDYIRSMARMRRSMGGGAGAFPAPGATDTTPEGAPASGDAANAANANTFANPFAAFGAPPGANPFGVAAGANPFAALMGPNPFAAMGGGSSGTAAARTGSGDQARSATTGSTTTGAAPTTAGTGVAAGGNNAAGANAAANPFAALFGGAPGAGPAGMDGMFGQVTPEMMQNAMQFLGGMQGGPSPVAPPDNRPPEERYAEQLRTLNDMGFFDFDQNVAALRRSGGSVQGAIEHLLNN